MKKIIILSALILGALYSNAQTVQDGLQYTDQDSYGTARFRALSGAFGALGGDLSAIGINPAGSTVFANNYAGFTLSFNNNDNSSTYFNNTTSQNNTDFTIGQAGGVLVFVGSGEEPVTKFSFGLNYDNTRNFDNTVSIRGVSPTSISSYFLNNANGIELDNFIVRRGDGETVDDLYGFLFSEFGFGAQQGFLGYESFLINADDPDDPFNTTYNSATGTGDFNQDYLVETTGYQSKLSLNGALELNDRWSLGLNLNSHIINFERLTSITESNSTADATISDVRYNNTLITEAGGFSFQAGFIGKITNQLRIGATYESPTWYNVRESNIQDIRTLSPADELAVVNPLSINVFPEYTLRSPGSVTGSLAYIFGSSGLISVDYSTRDYSNLKFTPDSAPLFQENNAIASESLQRAGDLRIGGEYRVSNWTLRGGYRMQDSPYENEEIMSDLTGYSLGLGYTWGKTTLDISYDRSERDYSQQLFDTGLTTSSRIENTMNNVVFTLGFNL